MQKYGCENVIVNSGWIYVHVPDTYKSCKMNTE